MKKFTIIAICIFLVCGIMFYFISMPRNVSGVTAGGGVLDLTGEDFSGTLFRFDGEWEFYYGELYSPEDFAGGRTAGGALIQVPMSWDEAGYPRLGFATYRLTVLVNEPEFLMLIPEIPSACVIWVNGAKIFEAGKVGRTETVVSARNAFATLRPEDGRLEIIVQASNHGYMIGSGMLYSVETGRSAVLLSDAAGRRLLLCIFIGLAFAMFFYHMMVFAYRRGERAYLYFAMYCLSTAIRFMIGTNAIAALLLPQGVGAGLVRLYLLMMTTQAVSMVLFTHTVFNIHLKNRLVNIVYGLSFGLMLLIAFIPGRVNPESIIVVMIPLITVLIVSLRSKRLRDTPYNMLLVLSIVIFIVWTPINRIFLDNSLYMSPLMGNLFLLLSQCAILSVSYAETKRREEELTAKTDVYRRVSHNLRTPLTRASTSIQVAKAKPEMAEELLADAQAEIMDMAEIIGEALRDGTEVPGR